MRLFLVALAAMALAAAGPAPPPNYDKVERKLVKEPAYKSKNPRYGLLLFGRAAALCVWLVLDGGTLYLDRDGDGDLTGKGERFASVSACRNVTLADPDGKASYVITGIDSYDEKDTASLHLSVNVDVKGPLEYRQYCDLKMAKSQAEAPLAHFNGPLTAGPVTVNWKVPPGLALQLGEKPADLRAVVGTMSARHGCWVVVRSDNGAGPAFPAGVHPAVEVEFPARAAGGPALRRRYTLPEFC